MSSTNRGAERIDLDAYYTPDAVAKACVATLGLKHGDAVWEPHAGGGAFVRALPDGVYRYASDINPDAPGLKDARVRFVGDFLQYRDDGAGAFTWILGNPPFTEAEAHVRKALALTNYGVAFLLRLAFLESAARVPFWEEHPPAAVYVFSKRPSFMGGKTDSCAYGWFVWRKNHALPPVLSWLKW